MSKVFRMSPVKGALASLLCAAPVAVAAMAVTASEADAYSKRVEKACESDYDRHCPHYKPRTAAARSCMELAGRRGNLRPRCLDALDDAGMIPKKYRRKR